MALTAGSVAVTDAGVVSKNGMAEAIYDAFVNNYVTDNGCPLPPENGSAAELAQRVAILRGYAVTATRLAVAIVSHITTNAAVSVTMPATPAGDGYQRDADGANPDCLGPLAPKALTGTVA